MHTINSDSIVHNKIAVEQALVNVVYRNVIRTLDNMSDHQYGPIRAREGQAGGEYYLEREGALVALACILHEPAPACEREGCERDALDLHLKRIVSKRIINVSVLVVGEYRSTGAPGCQERPELFMLHAYTIHI